MVAAIPMMVSKAVTIRCHNKIKQETKPKLMTQFDLTIQETSGRNKLYLNVLYRACRGILCETS